MARELLRLGRGIDAAADLHWRGKSWDPASAAAVVAFPLLPSPFLLPPSLLPLPLLPLLALRKESSTYKWAKEGRKGVRRQRAQQENSPIPLGHAEGQLHGSNCTFGAGLAGTAVGLTTRAQNTMMSRYKRG